MQATGILETGNKSLCIHLLTSDAFLSRTALQVNLKNKSIRLSGESTDVSNLAYKDMTS